MTIGNQTTATKAVEMVVKALDDASKNGWYLNKISSLTTSRPAYTLPPSRPAGAPLSPDGDVGALSTRVNRLEQELAGLKQELKSVAAHLEEAVGPHHEGAHKNHWWSRR